MFASARVYEIHRDRATVCPRVFLQCVGVHVPSVYNNSDFGPWLGGGLTVKATSWPPNSTAAFGADSYCAIDGRVFENVLGVGDKSLTGARYFTPAEVEVFAVARP